MSLLPGTTLGPYQVIALIGAGGMGEVYRARDTKLNRDVALKILPEAFTSDTNRLARFKREAQVLASVNHPNIAAVYDFEDSSRISALVMELVEGDTLAEVIARRTRSLGQMLPLEDTLSIARQVAEALEAAHEKGIVHRDLKPGNIKITDEGKAKVLDFGLARTTEKGKADSNLTHSPTLSLVATQEGVILGTAAYMSPEQAKGFSADHRSDIFSFGVVLLEMLTGRLPFPGETAAEVMAAVLVGEPDMTGLPQDLNPRLVDLVRRCLEKNPRKRWQAIGDIRAELETIAAAPRAVPTRAAPLRERPLWQRAMPAIVSAVVAAAATAAVTWSLKPSDDRKNVTRFSVALGEDQRLSNVGRHSVAMSPDGSRMVYVANQRLYMRSMSEPDAKPIPETENPGGVTCPVFSPDGQSIAYWMSIDTAAGAIRKIAVSGGAPVTVAPATNPFDINWDGDWIFFGQGAGGIMRVPSAGGKPEMVVSVKDGELAHGPQMLPDGDHLLFTLASTASDTSTRWDNAQVVVQSLKTGERKTIIEGGSDARYAPTGHLVYALGGTMFAVPFDARTLQVRGGPAPVVEGVARANANQTGTAHISFSTTGSLMYVPGPLAPLLDRLDLAFVDRAGKLTPLKLPLGLYQHARFSPDGKHVAYALNDRKDTQIWIYDVDGGAQRKLTFGGSINRAPVWTPDGQRIAFQSDREKDLGIFWQRADTPGAAERLTKAEEGTTHTPESFSPSGDVMLYAINRGKTFALWTYSTRDKTTAAFDSVESFSPPGSAFSADGRWVAYTVDDTLLVQPYPPTGARYQLTKPNGGHHPMWSADGRELLYEAGLNQLLSVPVQKQATFAVGNPSVLGAGVFGTSSPSQLRDRDLAPDGQRFVTPVTASQISASPIGFSEIRVVLNWFEDLKARAPAK